jgi:esterase/lipase
VITVEQPVSTERVDPRPQMCAFVLHGLNTSPSKMNSIATLLKTHSQNVQLGTLSGHSDDTAADNEISASIWKSEFLQQWRNAMTGCEGQTRERVFAGYSLGALVALTLLDESTQMPIPTRLILIAPALKLRKKVLFVKALSWLRFGGLPSLNHVDYRANRWTSFVAYNALFDLNNSWNRNAWEISKSIPTVVFLAEDDELVDSQEIAEKTKTMSQWTTVWLDNSASQLNPKYHHLMLDEDSLGPESWKKMKSAIDQMLTKSADTIGRSKNIGD